MWTHPVRNSDQHTGQTWCVLLRLCSENAQHVVSDVCLVFTQFSGHTQPKTAAAVTPTCWSCCVVGFWMQLTHNTRQLGHRCILSHTSCLRLLHMLLGPAAAAYQLPATGRDGTVRPFEKPWFMVLLMFLGECSSGVCLDRGSRCGVHHSTLARLGSPKVQLAWCTDRW